MDEAPHLSTCMICVLKVVEGPCKGMQCWLKSGQRLTIGRQTDCDFRISDDIHLSRNHLVVEGLTDTFRIRDLGSSNGTLVNDFAISVVELCDGDRIQAGTSVFEVEMQSDSSPAVVEPASPEHQSKFGQLPKRSLSLDQLTHDQELTMRYSLDSLLELPLPGGRPAAEIKSALAAAKQQVPWTGSGGADHSDPHDSDLDSSESSGVAEVAQRSQPVGNFVLPSKFMAGFTQSSNPILWRQTAEAALWEPVRLVDCLANADLPWKLSLIVNRMQLSSLRLRELDAAIASGEAHTLCEALCLMHSADPRRVLSMYRSSLTRDAAICIGSEQQLSQDWLDQVLDVMSYPSMLFDQLSRQPERVTQWVQSVHFILFEPNRQGELCMLRAGH